ncbi:MAG: dihydroneopterin aldolase [Cyanobacteria bacterium P01_F01_bin.42]
MDCLQINGIRAYGYVGFFPEEKTLGQWFQVNLKVDTDLQTAAQGDDLSQTLNYAEVVTLTQSIIAAARVDLIETLAVDILDQILKLDNVCAVQIQLTKENPPIPNFSGSVTVQIRRTKNQMQELNFDG